MWMKPFAGLLSALLILLSPGLAPYPLFAQVSRSGGLSSGSYKAWAGALRGYLNAFELSKTPSRDLRSNMFVAALYSLRGIGFERGAGKDIGRGIAEELQSQGVVLEDFQKMVDEMYKVQSERKRTELEEKVERTLVRVTFDVLSRQAQGSVTKTVKSWERPGDSDSAPAVPATGWKSLVDASKADEDLSKAKSDPLHVALPKNLHSLSRPTRLQTLLQKTHFDKLKKTDKNPQIAELLAESKSAIAWREFPDSAHYVLDYVEYFSLEDLIYMAASEEYAHKVAGELRTYANVKMGGNTSLFRNNDIYWAARILVDRWRIKQAGFPAIKDAAQLGLEAQRAGATMQTKTRLYLVLAKSPEAVKGLSSIRGSAEGVEAESILESYARRGIWGKKRDSSRPSRLVGLHGEPGKGKGSQKIGEAEARKILIARVKAYSREKDGYDYPVEQLLKDGEPVSKIVKKIISAAVGFEYEVSDLPAVKPGTLNELWVAAEVPVSQIKRWRRFYTIEYKYKVQKAYSSDSERIDDGTMLVAEDWQEMRSLGPVAKEPKQVSADNRLKGKTFVFTGTLKTMTRSEAEGKVRELGGEAVSGVSSKTDYVVVGEDPGSKYGKAQKLGVKVLSEEEFKNLVRDR